MSFDWNTIPLGTEWTKFVTEKGGTATQEMLSEFVTRQSAVGANRAALCPDFCPPLAFPPSPV